MSKLLKFPNNFLWGSATSSHQVEGGNDNDWSEWEKSEKRIQELKAKGEDPKGYISGRACDSYHLYEKDLDIAQSLGHNIHRFSIEWSRIEPEEGKFDQNEIEHYKKVIDAVRARGMEPMVTLWHFTSPKWFAAKGGWADSAAPERFLRFIKVIVPALKDRVGLWITLNEAATVYAGHSYLARNWPPQQRSFRAYLKVRKNFVKAHILAYKEIKKIYSSPEIVAPLLPPILMSHNVGSPLIGSAENNSEIVTGWLLRILGIQKFLNYFIYLYFWSKTKKYHDFIGLNYYTIKRFAGSLKTLPRQDWVPDMRWEIYPKGIYQRLMDVSRYGKPIFITENGTSDQDDKFREKFIRDHLVWVHKAIQDGADVKGYLYWSLLDNFEWAAGYKPRFGLVSIDYATLERQVRPSALEYAKICKSNQFEI